MSHVQIKTGSEFLVAIDGVDITKYVLAEGFSVTLPTSPDEEAKVHLVLAVDDLDLDLIEAVVNPARRMCDPGIERVVRAIEDLPDRVAKAASRGSRRSDGKHR